MRKRDFSCLTICTCLSWSFVLTRCCTLTWVTKILMTAISNVHASRRFPTPALQHVSIFCSLAGSAEVSPLDFTGTVNSNLNVS